MVNCCVPLCKSYKGRPQSKVVRFHEIPSTNIREKWLAAISRQGPVKGSKWIPTDHSCVCSLHFRNEDYKQTPKRRNLKPDVVPSIFPNYPSYLVHKNNTSRTERVTSGSDNAISVTRAGTEVKSTDGVEPKPTTSRKKTSKKQPRKMLLLPEEADDHLTLVNSEQNQVPGEGADTVSTSSQKKPPKKPQARKILLPPNEPDDSLKVAHSEQSSREVHPAYGLSAVSVSSNEAQSQQPTHSDPPVSNVLISSIKVEPLPSLCEFDEFEDPLYNQESRPSSRSAEVPLDEERNWTNLPGNNYGSPTSVITWPGSTTEEEISRTCPKEVRIMVERLELTSAVSTATQEFSLLKRRKQPDKAPPTRRSKRSSRKVGGARRKRLKTDQSETQQISRAEDPPQPTSVEERQNEGGICAVCKKFDDQGTKLTSLTDTSKEPFFEKLMRLIIGEKELSVSEDEILCSICTRLVNHMDRMEVELSMLKRGILNCMRKKQCLQQTPQCNTDLIESGETGKNTDASAAVPNQNVKEEFVAMDDDVDENDYEMDHDNYMVDHGYSEPEVERQTPEYHQSSSLSRNDVAIKGKTNNRAEQNLTVETSLLNRSATDENGIISDNFAIDHGYSSPPKRPPEHSTSNLPGTLHPEEASIEEKTDNIPTVNESLQMDPAVIPHKCKMCAFQTMHQSVILFHLRQHLKYELRCDFCNIDIPQNSERSERILSRHPYRHKTFFYSCPPGKTSLVNNTMEGLNSLTDSVTKDAEPLTTEIHPQKKQTQN